MSLYQNVIVYNTTMTLALQIGLIAAKGAGFLSRLFFTDLDRTLMTHDYRIHPRVISAFKEAHRSGLQIVITTARSPHSLRPIATQLEVDALAVCFNGAWIGNLRTMQPIHTARIPGEIAGDIMQEIHRLEGQATWYDAASVQTYQLTPVISNHLRQIGEQGWAVASFDGRIDGPFKILCIDDRAQTCFSKLVSTWSTQCNLAQSHKVFLEIGPKDVTKGTGIAHVARLFNVELADCGAAGDSQNDLPMLSIVGNAYSVDNADTNVKALARFIGPSCDEGGLADVIYRHLHN